MDCPDVTQGDIERHGCRIAKRAKDKQVEAGKTKLCQNSAKAVDINRVRQHWQRRLRGFQMDCKETQERCNVSLL